MILHHLGVLPYEKAREKMMHIHAQALIDGQNHLMMTEHPNVFTIGKDAWQKSWSVDTLKSDRGGSITCHSPGQNIYYFCFQTPQPARFFSHVIEVYKRFLEHYHKDFFYDKKNPGFYIQNRKIISLGFRYKDAVSLHGVAVNVDVDLAFHAQVNPCNLEDIIPTSLSFEGINVSQEEVDKLVLHHILECFDESL